MIQLTVKLPNPQLFPNRKNGGHWAKTYSAKNIDRNYGWKVALSTKHSFTSQDKISMKLIFYFKDRYHRDADNCVAAFKGLQDGIAIGLKINDNQFLLNGVSLEYDRNNPRCEVFLEKISIVAV